jgi:hypothetical protein
MASVSSDYTAAEALAAPVVTPLGCVPSYNGYLPFVSTE